MKRKLTPFEKRLASALKNADMLQRALKREHLSSFYAISIHMGSEAYAKTRMWAGMPRDGRTFLDGAYESGQMFGFPVIVNSDLGLDQIAVQCSMNIPEE